MTRYDHIPTVEEAGAAQREVGLPETWWWVTGWGFNRPTIARLNVSCHVEHGPCVRVTVGNNCPEWGWKSEELAGISFVFVGPIPCPREKLAES